MSNMTPREIVHDLDKHIIGQSDAKRAVAIALRNRWRRMQLSEEVRNLFIYHVTCVSRGGALHVRLIRRLDVRIYPLKVWKSALLPLNKRLNVSRNPLCVLDPRSAHRSRFLSQKAKTEEELQVDLVKNCLLDSSSVRLWMKSTYMVRYFISTCIQYLSVCPTRANPTTPSQVSGCVWFTLGK